MSELNNENCTWKHRCEHIQNIIGDERKKTTVHLKYKCNSTLFTLFRH